MFRRVFSVFLALLAAIFYCHCQEYDFAAEITRQCLVPDPVGLLDCVENKVTLPYLTSWVDCTNSLGQNVKTSADIINYRCKSVWEGKGVIPEVFYIKDCVIEKTGLPAKNVSAEVLGAYKECESTPKSQQRGIKTAPIQQQQITQSRVEYKPPTVEQIQQPIQRPVQPQQQLTVQRQVQQPLQIPSTLPISQQPVAIQQPFQAPVTRLAPFQQPIMVQRPVQLQQPVMVQRPIQSQQPVQPQVFVQQAPIQTTLPFQQVSGRSQVAQQQMPVNSQYPSSVHSQQRMPLSAQQPYSQQFFMIYPQAPLPQAQQNVNNPNLSQKTIPNPSYITQQALDSTKQVNSLNPVSNSPYSYSFQIKHPQRPVL